MAISNNYLNLSSLSLLLKYDCRVAQSVHRMQCRYNETLNGQNLISHFKRVMNPTQLGKVL